MAMFVALLRGINVGKAKRIPMVDLRALLLELGYTDVTTLLNSGNVVFNATTGTPIKLASDIANGISKWLKIEVPVIVKSAKDLSAIVSENLLAGHAPDHSRLLVAFVQDTKALPELAVIEQLVVPPEQFLLGRNAAFLHCPISIIESRAWNALLGKTNRTATTRNWATVLKLHTLACVPNA